MFIPKPYDAQVLNLLFDLTATNDPNSWAPAPLLTYVEHTPINNITEIVDPNGLPILVRNYVDPPSEKFILDTLIEKNKGRPIRVLDWRNRTENHISPACGGVPKNKITMNFEEYAAKLESVRNLYAGFEKLTDAEVVSKFLGFQMEDIIPGQYKQNNLFLSNFDRTLMSAGLHCAPIDSVAIQLVGKKTWLLASPDQLAEVKAIPMPTFFPLSMTDDELFTKFSEFRVVEAGPGDALYFGPNWCHAVITHEGTNVMFNARFNARQKFLDGNKWNLLRLIFRKWTRDFAGNPQDNVETQGPLYDTINNQFEDCKTSNRLEEIVKKFTKFGERSYEDN